MPCSPDILQEVPLFALLDEEERAVLANEVELRRFAARQRIYKLGDSGGLAYVVISGEIHVTTVDEDQQEIVIDEPAPGDFFGFASMLDGMPHQTSASAVTEALCIEVSREDIAILLQRKPLAGMDLLSVLGKQFHASQQLVRLRAARNANEMIEEKTTWGERLADVVARFGGSWYFISTFGLALLIWTGVNQGLGRSAWDPYPFILLNLFMSMIAAIQAPVIMMSQNRQDSKDRLRSELDYDVNRRSEQQIRGLAAKLNRMQEKLDDIEDFLRAADLAKESKVDH
ncbi:MAG: DUF1003 domain-containing protein [Bryobacteraceae bacterium]|nr:DUF1003 domain-containing protein [Bryobacteraceae bacterium]